MAYPETRPHHIIQSHELAQLPMPCFAFDSAVSIYFSRIMNFSSHGNFLNSYKKQFL
jgi:hypothetical protein